MSEKSVNILEIITGALMIAAPLFGWWGSIESGTTVSIAFWEWGIYDEIAVFCLKFTRIFDEMQPIIQSFAIISLDF